MSLETYEFLNGGNILVGDGVRPWWLDENMIAAMIASGQMTESPLCDGPVPLDKARALLAEVITGFEMAALKSLEDDETATLFLADGTPYPYRVVIAEDRQLIGPVARDVFFMAASGGYDTDSHQFGDVLLDATEAIIGESLHLQTVGRLRDGAQAFVSVGVPESFQTPEGIVFSPRLIAGSSFDGKLATQWGRVFQLGVCDNTMRAAFAEASRSGQLVKVKHTKHSFLGIANAREGLNLLEDGAEAFAEEIKTLCETEVSSSEWNSVLDALVPLPVDSEGKVTEKGRGYTMAATKRETLQGLLTGDERVSPWSGTAFGVLQAFNTYNAHEAIVRGDVSRPERQYENVLTGKTFKEDANVLHVLKEVCENAKELQLA